jgi:hypothetical protein
MKKHWSEAQIMELGAFIYRVPLWHADVYAVAGCRIAG